MSYDDDYSYFIPRQQTPMMGGMMQNFPQMLPQMLPMQQQQGIPMPTFPTGVPAGPIVAPIPGVTQIPPATPIPQPVQTMESTQFVPGYLRTQIGKSVRVEFLIGTNGPLVDRIGTLLAVGASYIIIRPIDTDDALMCDLYSIKFVTTML